MNRLCLAGALALAALATTAVGATETNAQRMNVLLIISDDMRTELGCYASRLARTPNLDRMASTGVRFERAYCQFPLCNPSRASMLTGRHPTTTGVLGNRTWFGDTHPDFVSLPKHFKNHGYVTVRAGKIFHGGIDDTDAWSENGQVRTLAGVPGAGGQTSTGGGRKPSATPADPDEDTGAAKAGGPRLTKNQRSDRRVVLEGMGQSHGDYKTADRTIEALRRLKDQPFFIGCGFLKPHSPPEAPQRFYDLWKIEDIPLPPDFAPRPTVPPGFPAGCIRPQNADLFIGRDASPEEARQMIRAYLASSAWMDWNVGRVLAALDELGLREKTLVVFWGDHGYQLGEKGKWSKAGSLWEQGTRTPFFICDPRQAAGQGRVCSRVVQMVDLYPTLTELCGLEPAAGLEGRSLVPLMRDPGAPWPHPAFTVWSEDGRSLSGILVRTERWRYAEFFGRGPGAMLIDPAEDPVELRNLANDPNYAEVVAELSGMVQGYAAGHPLAQESTH